MNSKNITTLFTLLHHEFPNPKTELNYSSTFELLIAVILSAHTTDKSVNQATVKLFPVANTPQKILSLGITRLKKYIKSIGLYNTKATNIIKTCKILKLEHNSQVPDQRELLEKLPGVGRKTASVILNIAFNQPTIAVDTHIFRVANRTGLAKGKTPLEVEKKLLQITPKKFMKIAHHLLLLHGRYICKAQKPLCEKCIINKLCAKKIMRREENCPAPLLTYLTS